MRTLTIRVSAFNESQFIVNSRLKGREAEAISFLPFYETETKWRTTLIKILEFNGFSPDKNFPDNFSENFYNKLSPEERTWMEQEGLLMPDGSGFSKDYLQKIGQQLYKSLFPVGEVRDLLQQSIALAEQDSNPLHIQIEFKANVTELNRLPDYPWEMVHNGQNFLANKDVTFSRYIAHLDSPPILSPVSKINVLLVSSGASDQDNGFGLLSPQENEAVKEALKQSDLQGHIRLIELKTASFKKLEAYLTKNRGDNAPHVLHFDGHGAFGKRCLDNKCRTFHSKLNLDKCTKCKTPLPDPQGYLLFEPDEDDNNKKANYVSSEILGRLLQSIRYGDTKEQQGGIRLAVLSACKSAYTSRGNSVFNGVAQSLIWHGVPAVVAMQYTVSVESATAFAERFYQELGNKQSLAVATSQGRVAMQNIEHNQWYRLIFYLRWQDNEGGQLFAQQQQIAQDEQIQRVIPKNLKDNSHKIIKFVGRDTNLKELDKHFKKYSRIIITGLGGVGKSTLADQYARKSYEKKAYPGGLWLIEKESVADIEIELRRFFRRLLNDLSAPNNEIQEELYFYLQKLEDLKDKPRVLLILDGITEESYEKINDEYKYLPDDQNFKVLIITPKPFGELLTLPLRVLEREASIELLTAYAEDEVKKDPEKANNICQQLEDMPLALKFVGKWLQTDTLENIYSELKEVGIKSIVGQYPKIFEAFEVNWKHLDLVTQNFAYLLSLFASTPISWALIKELEKKFNRTEFGRNNENTLNAKSELITFNLIQKNLGNFGQCHQFFQKFLEKKLKDLSKNNESQAKNLKRIFYQVMAEEARKIPPEPTRQELEEVKDFIPHLNKVVQEMRQDLQDKELVDLFIGLGRYYEGNRHYTEAIKQYEDCLKIMSERLGEKHPYIFKIQNALAHLYLLYKDFNKAESLYQKALKGGEQWLEENAPDSLELRETYLNIATSKDNLGYLYLCLYDRDKFYKEAKLFLNKAESLLKEALEIREKLFAQEKPNVEHQDDIPHNLDNLAMFHRLRQEWNQAEEYYKKALEIRQETQRNHPLLAESYNNSAINYFDLAIFYNSAKENRDDEKAKQNYEKAKLMFIQAVEIGKHFYGEMDIKVARILYNLANTYFELGEYNLAIEIYKETLNIKKTIWGEHLDVAENMKTLAACYQMIENYKDAMDLFNQALDLIELLDKSKDLQGQKSLIEEIYDELQDLVEDYPDAQSLFNRVWDLSCQ